MKKVFFFSVIALNIVVLVSFGVVLFMQHSKQNTITAKEAGDKVISLVDRHFVSKKKAKLSGVPVEEKNFYRIGLDVFGKTEIFYITKDGLSLILPRGMIDIAQFEKDMLTYPKPEQASIPKSQRPIVELFVMSLCPYGVKAQKEMLPIAREFGDAIDFRIKFIVIAKGDTLEGIASLHGRDEVREDAREAAIMRMYPERFSSYVDKISENSCLISCGAVKLEEYWKKSAQAQRMDVKKIEAFAYGREGIASLQQDASDAKKYNVNASPTLVINGMQTKAIYNGPEALKAGICSAFLEPSSMCQKDN